MLVEIERRFHTWMACETLAGLEAFGALPPEERRIIFPAVLLHDMGKPATMRLAWTDGSRLAGTGRCGAIQA